MAVKKQKTTKGETKYYHYRFMSKGKLYQGVCKGCTTERDALKYEVGIKAKVKKLEVQETHKALIENFRDELTGATKITLTDAFELFLKKPRKKTITGSNLKFKKKSWSDFCEYMDNYYPDVKRLSDVQIKHAEEYIQYVRCHGRFNKAVIYQVNDKVKQYTRDTPLSNRTCNAIHQVLKEVFDRLHRDSGLLENPFSDIKMLNNKTESRDAFNEDELVLISEKADGFIRAIFTIGIATALREGDICTLRWAEIDLKNNIISRKMLKTNRTVEIPILPPLRNFLEGQRIVSGDDEYVLPEHAQMYLKNQSGITWRVKKFLESIGIKTTKKVPGRSRAVSIKDVHSLRHTFCYYAGVYGIPFLVVKDIVGHVSPQMTELYQKHADNRVKREKLMLMPDFMGLGTGESSALPEVTTEPERDQLVALAQTVDIEQVREALKVLSG